MLKRVDKIFSSTRLKGTQETALAFIMQKKIRTKVAKRNEFEDNVSAYIRKKSDGGYQNGIKEEEVKKR